MKKSLPIAMFFSGVLAAFAQTEQPYTLEQLDQAWANHDYAVCEQVIASLREDPVEQAKLEKAEFDLGMANIFMDDEAARDHLGHFLLGGEFDNSENAEQARLTYARILAMEGRFAEAQALLLTLATSPNPTVVYKAFNRAKEFGLDSETVADTWLIALEAALLSGPESPIEGKIANTIKWLEPTVRAQHGDLKKLMRKGKQEFYLARNGKCTSYQVQETWQKVLNELPALDPVNPTGDHFIDTSQIDARFFLGTAKLGNGEYQECRRLMQEIQEVTWSKNDKIGTSYSWVVSCDQREGFSAYEMKSRLLNMVKQTNINPISITHCFSTYAGICEKMGEKQECYAALRDIMEILPDRKHTMRLAKWKSQLDRDSPELSAATVNLQSQIRLAMRNAGRLDYYDGHEVIKQWLANKQDQQILASAQ